MAVQTAGHLTEQRHVVDTHTRTLEVATPATGTGETSPLRSSEARYGALDQFQNLWELVASTNQMIERKLTTTTCLRRKQAIRYHSDVTQPNLF